MLQEVYISLVKAIANLNNNTSSAFVILKFPGQVLKWRNLSVCARKLLLNKSGDAQTVPIGNLPKGGYAEIKGFQRVIIPFDAC